MSKSVLEYLASLRQNGCTPENIGEVTIGRTVYAAGSFNNRGATEIALMPMYRKDWIAYNHVGPIPELLPASYRRSHRTVYVDNYGKTWYIAGWTTGEGVLWLHSARYPDIFENSHRHMSIDVHWRESFQTAMRLASPEVLARIENQS